MSFCPFSSLHQWAQISNVRPLMRLENEQKSGALSVDFNISVALKFPWDQSCFPGRAFH